MTISDVARAAGVSRGTVSNVLNHPERVRSDKLAAVEHAIEALGYRPNVSAQTLAGGVRRAFGMILTGWGHDFSRQLAHGAQDAAVDAGYDLLIACTNNDDFMEHHYRDYFAGARMSGMIVEPRAQAGWRLESMGESGNMPIVVLDVDARPEQHCFVSADNLEVGRIAAQHALACGRRHIAVVTGREQVQSLTQRIAGIREVLDSRSDVTLEMLDQPHWASFDEARALGAELVRRPSETRPDFVIGLTDVLAAGVIESLVEGGVRVPQDVAVMGCDGNPLSWGTPVRMTTIKPHGYEMGRVAVDALVREVTEGADHRHTVTCVAAELLTGESTVGTSVRKSIHWTPDGVFPSI